MKQGLHRLFHAIFWGWNLVFLFVTYVGILPVVGWPLAIATLNGQIPIEFSLTLVALVAVPTLATVIGVRRFLNQPLQLLRLFYGVEAPLFVLCLLRLFLLRELTIASFSILAGVSICIVAFFGELLYGYASKRRSIAWLQLVAHSLMGLVGVYVGVLLLFYAVPTAAFLVQQFFSFSWAHLLWDGLTLEFFLYGFFWLCILMVLVALSGTLFVAMPSVMATLYLHSAQQGVRTFAAQYGRRSALIGSVSVIVATLVLFTAVQGQPQTKAFSLLEQPVQTQQARQALLTQSDSIRIGLLNAYLANYRYLTSTQENDHIRLLYERIFGLPLPLSQGLQYLYNQLMAPFLYQGSFADVDKAGQLYAQFFDAPIQKAEQDSINHALQSTFNQDEAKAGLLNLNQRKVWLRSQAITVQAHEDWADIELHEIYENQTPQQQEVFYSFTLPESAVITGLWLGDTDDLSQRFPFVVAPRGAAQQVYNDQVQRRVDPALLEQVGPRQYRLRAFPVPPRTRLNSDNQPQPELHLWLTYKVMRQTQGWAMPQLAQKRNLFWTTQTQRLRNGQEESPQMDVWVEPFLDAEQPQPPRSHETNFPDGHRISVRPLAATDYALPQNQRFALVLDSSRSMADQVKALDQTMQWLQQHGFANRTLADNDADLYITAATGGTPERLDDIRQFDPAQTTFYGMVQPQEMLRQFTQLKGETPYNGILVITDEGSYALSDETQTVPPLAAPLWMVHLGGLSGAYDDTTLQAIQASGGGVATTIPDVLHRLATQAALGPTAVNVVDGYAWLLEQTDLSLAGTSETEALPDAGFTPLAARQFILGLSQEKNAQQLVHLDSMHRIAKTTGIVTPYSSMIVLVNDQQREALKRAETEGDRFQREVESGNETLSKPFDPMNQAVPEPTEGLAVVIAMVVLFGFKRLVWDKLIKLPSEG